MGFAKICNYINKECTDNIQDSVSQWMNYIHHGIMDAAHDRTGDVSLDLSCNWMSYCNNHSEMDAPQYAHADVPSGYLFDWMFYYTNHSDMDAPQYVHVHVHSDYV